MAYGAQHGLAPVVGRQRVLWRDHFQQQLMAAGACGGPDLLQPGILLGAQCGRVVGVVEDQAFDGMALRPVQQLGSQRVRAVKAQRARARQLDGPAYPPAASRGVVQRGLAQVMAAVDQHAHAARVARIALDLGDHLVDQPLERAQPRGRCAGLARQIVELAAVVIGQHAQRGPLRPRAADAVQVGQLGVLVGTRMAVAREPVRQLGLRGHGRRAAMARDHDGAAGVGNRRRFLQALAAQQPGQQARGKGIARAQHIEHLHALAQHRGRIGDRIGHLALDQRAAQRPALDHEDGAAAFAHAAQAGDQVALHAAGDQPFLLGADDEFELAQLGLQPAADLGAGHIACLAVAPSGQAPQHGPVVDVQHAHQAVAACHLQCLAAGGQHAGCAQVGARDGQAAAAGQERLADGLGVQGHVGAVLAGEEQGEGLLVLDAQQHHAGQALGIDLHLAGVAALAAQRLDQEAAVVLIAHARNHGRAQPQARRAESHVARGAAQVLGKAAGLLQAAADLLRVKVHGQSAQAGHVQRPVGGKVQHAHRHRPVRCGHPRAGLSIIVACMRS